MADRSVYGLSRREIEELILNLAGYIGTLEGFVKLDSDSPNTEALKEKIIKIQKSSNFLKYEVLGWTR